MIELNLVQDFLDATIIQGKKFVFGFSKHKQNPQSLK